MRGISWVPAQYAKFDSFSDKEEVKTSSHSLKGGKGGSGNTSV